MATSFLNTLPKACFSSALEDVRVTTDADFVVCTVRDSAGGLVIQLKSYPYRLAGSSSEGEAVFADLKSVISQWLLSNDLLMQRFEIRVSEDWDEQRAECVADLLVAYCAYGVPSVSSNNKEGKGDASESLFDAMVEGRFLSTLQSKVIYPEVGESLSLIALPAAETAMKIEGFIEGEDGKPVAVETEVTGQATSDDYTSCDYAISLEDIAERLGGRPLAFTCTVGSRLFSFYAAKQLPTCTFRFRNAFNAVETAAFFGVTTAKQEVEREEAVSGGKTSFYDEHTAQSYEVESAALDADFAAWLAQLLASPDVRLWQKGKAWEDLPRILITESTYEVSDSDADQRTVKFTWRYADDAPQLPTALLPADGVFNENYNPLFS